MKCKISINDREKTKYSRQICLEEIGIDGQSCIKGASVIVVGAGALGSPVLQYLTAAGVGDLGIVDNDWVDETNLQRQVLYGVKDIGKPKPLAARERLRNLNPEVRFHMHYIRLERENAIDLLKNYDIIVDCTDNFGTRYLINDASVILNKPVVYGAIHRFSGQLVVLNYMGGPTLRCIYPVPPHPLEVQSCDEACVIGSIGGTIGSMQATEVLKIILGLDGVLSGKLFFIESINFFPQVFSFSRNPRNSEIKVLGEYPGMCLGGDENICDLSLAEFRIMSEKLPGLKVIDLRDEKDKKDIGLKTISMPFHLISQKLHHLKSDGLKVFYCNNGIKSAIVINYLRRERGLDELYRLVI